MMIKALFIAASFVPLLIHSTYLWQAWTGSRLDQWDWIFYLITLPAAFWAVYKEKSGKWDFYALFLLLPALLLTFAVPLHNINALAVASAVGVIFSSMPSQSRTASGYGTWLSMAMSANSLIFCLLE